MEETVDVVTDEDAEPSSVETHLLNLDLDQEEADTVNKTTQFLSPEENVPSKLVDSKYEMEVQQQEDGSRKYISSFEELVMKPELLTGLFCMGITVPSKFQKTALPVLLSDPPQNLIAQFQCGMGKTTAFVLASLCRVDPEKKFPQVLVLSPASDLAVQTSLLARQMTKHYPEIKIHLALKGKEPDPGQKLKGQVLVGTPGIVTEWANRYHFFDIKKIAVFVFDEADVMLDTAAHKDQSIRIHKSLSKNCQTMLFLPTYKKRVMDFAEKLIREPVVLCLRKEEYLDNIRQYYILCKNDEEKMNAISNIYGVIVVSQSIFFCHTRKTALWLAGAMIRNGHTVGLLSGDLTMEQRLHVLNRFRKGRFDVMITTDVCARAIWKWYPYRGIEKEQHVSIVFNFDIPLDQKQHVDSEVYLHRIGRTGYFTKTGLIINLVIGKNLNLIKQIEVYFGGKLDKLNANDPDEIEKLLECCAG